LGYDGVLIPEKYLNLLEAKLNSRIFYSRKMHVTVRKPYYGEDAQLLGGACNMLQMLFNGELFF
ncbi:MAG: ROK family protein, partial [Lachnospiraceae bacterium]|nr:ROK family protein [Lachnospiraceae bacterium]